jgi:hypothetical protein
VPSHYNRLLLAYDHRRVPMAAKKKGKKKAGKAKKAGKRKGKRKKG